MMEANLSTNSNPAFLSLETLPVVELEGQAMRDHRIVGFDSRDRRSRPFNLLRTSLARKLKEGGHRLVGITSATPAAGKSFLSLNLASSLSRISDGPVFLVDLDLRRGSLAEELGLQPEVGTESFLEGTVSELRRVGCRIEGSNLGIFPANGAIRNSAELLATQRFDQMIDMLRRSNASTVLIDLPPVFANDDAMIVLEHLDGYIMVVDAGKTTRRQLEDVVGLLNPTPCIGTILNRYRGGFGDTYGYGYGGANYSKYYDQPA